MISCTKTWKNYSEFHYKVQKHKTPNSISFEVLFSSKLLERSKVTEFGVLLDEF